MSLQAQILLAMCFACNTTMLWALADVPSEEMPEIDDELFMGMRRAIQHDQITYARWAMQWFGTPVKQQPDFKFPALCAFFDAQRQPQP